MVIFWHIEKDYSLIGTSHNLRVVREQRWVSESVNVCKLPAVGGITETTHRERGRLCMLVCKGTVYKMRWENESINHLLYR